MSKAGTQLWTTACSTMYYIRQYTKQRRHCVNGLWVNCLLWYLALRKQRYNLSWHGYKILITEILLKRAVKCHCSVWHRIVELFPEIHKLLSAVQQKNGSALSKRILPPVLLSTGIKPVTWSSTKRLHCDHWQRQLHHRFFVGHQVDLHTTAVTSIQHLGVALRWTTSTSNG